MYDDFSYIADEQFLQNYWNAEKLLHSYRQGLRKLSPENKIELLKSHLSQKTEKRSQKEHEDSILESNTTLIPVN